MRLGAALLAALSFGGCAVTRPVPGVPGQRVVEIVREEPHGPAWRDYKAYQSTKPTRMNMDDEERSQIGRTRIEVHEDGLIVVEQQRQTADLPRVTYRRRMPLAVPPLFAALDDVDEPVVYDFEHWCHHAGRAPLGDDELCHHPTASRRFGELVAQMVLAPHGDPTPGVAIAARGFAVELHDDGAWRCVVPRGPGDELIDEGQVTAVEAEPILRALRSTAEAERAGAWNEHAGAHLAPSCALP